MNSAIIYTLHKRSMDRGQLQGRTQGQDKNEVQKHKNQTVREAGLCYVIVYNVCVFNIDHAVLCLDIFEEFLQEQLSSIPCSIKASASCRHCCKVHQLWH